MYCCVRYYNENGKLICDKYDNLELAIDNSNQILDSEVYVSLNEYQNLECKVFELKSRIKMINDLTNEK